MGDGEPQVWAVGMTSGWAASLPGFEKGLQPFGMFPEELACSGAGVPVSHSHLVLSICRGRTVPRRGPQIRRFLLWSWYAERSWETPRRRRHSGSGDPAPLRAPLQCTCKGNTAGKMVKMLPGSPSAIGVWGPPQTCAFPSPGGQGGGQSPWRGCELSLPRCPR